MAEPVVNRDEAIPVIVVGPDDEEVEPGPRKRDAAKHMLASALSPSELPDQGGGSEVASPGIQDRLFAKLMQSVVPDPGASSDEDEPTMDVRSSKSIERPTFSLPLMTRNFRRFNSSLLQRIGVAFVFQAHLLRLLSWKSPTQTFSLLSLYTLVCLDPPLLFVLPLATVVLFIMIPAFVARHPAPVTALPTDPYPASGPPTAPARNIRPVADLSKDFFRNMRDLQNCMEDFTVVHDQVIATLAPWTNFSNEPLSTTVFVALFLLTCALFVASRFLPYRAVFLVVGWTAISQGHPKVQSFMRSNQKPIFDRQIKQAHQRLDHWIESDIVLDDALELREVEIFEVQRRENATDVFDIDAVAEWKTWIFSPSPYDPLSIDRIGSLGSTGALVFEEVQPPEGWDWGDKKWTLDLLSHEWVDARMITNVEVETEGERWVNDVVSDESGERRDDGAHKKTRIRNKGNSKGSEVKNDDGRVGYWRRRRWIRTVKRRQKHDSDA